MGQRSKLNMLKNNKQTQNDNAVVCASTKIICFQKGRRRNNKSKITRHSEKKNFYNLF